MIPQLHCNVVLYHSLLKQDYLLRQATESTRFFRLIFPTPSSQKNWFSHSQKMIRVQAPVINIRLNIVVVAIVKYSFSDIISALNRSGRGFCISLYETPKPYQNNSPSPHNNTSHSTTIFHSFPGPRLVHKICPPDDVNMSWWKCALGVLRNCQFTNLQQTPSKSLPPYLASVSQISSIKSIFSCLSQVIHFWASIFVMYISKKLKPVTWRTKFSRVLTLLKDIDLSGELKPLRILYLPYIRRNPH